MVEVRQAVTWTVYYTKNLRKRECKVNKLWNEKEHQGFGKVTQNTDYSKRHPCTVAERVSNEDLRWEHITFEKCKCAEKKRYDYGERVHVILCDVRRCILAQWYLDDVVNHDEAADDEGLADFDSINACVDINCISAKYRYIAHVKVVNEAEVNVTADKWTEDLGNDHWRQSFISNQKGEGGNSGDYNFMSPPQINHIVHESK